MKANKLKFFLIGFSILFPELLNASALNSSKSKLVSKGYEEEEIYDATQYIKKDKHNDRLKKRKEFENHSKYKNNDWYQDFKNELEKQYKISYTFDLSYMPQRGAPNGGKTPQQVIWSPYVSISPFTDTFLGSGQLQFSYTGIQYWGEQAEYLQDKLNIGTGINDYINNSTQFAQLVYTHTLPGKMNWLSVNIGQYSLYFIDGTSQDFNQQTGFISYSLSQNGTATYPVASLGAYLQFSPNSEWMMQLGFQDANNITGNKVDFKTLDDGEYTSYMYMSWSPTFFKTWAGQYMFLNYTQPSTNLQPGNSQGWSFSFSQYFGEVFNLFGRVNGSSGNIVSVRKSYVLGVGFKDLFNRNPNDYLGIGFTSNQISKEISTGSSIHKYENVIEVQYVIGLTKYLTITPDIQFFTNPALNTNQATATVYSLRFGLSI